MKNLFLAFVLTSMSVFAFNTETNEDDIKQNTDCELVSNSYNIYNSLTHFIYDTAQLCLVSVSTTEPGPFGYMYTHGLEYYTFALNDDHCDLINDVQQSNWEAGL